MKSDLLRILPQEIRELVIKCILPVFEIPDAKEAGSPANKLCVVASVLLAQVCIDCKSSIGILALFELI